MEVRAFLCDAATVREGLLHILGAGITRMNRQSFPAPVQASLAMMIVLHPTETGRLHKLEVRLQGSDGQPVFGAEAEFSAERGEDTQPGEMVAAPMVLPFHAAALPQAGAYSVEILVDGQHMSSLGFIAVQQFPPGLPSP